MAGPAKHQAVRRIPCFNLMLSLPSYLSPSPTYHFFLQPQLSKPSYKVV